MAETLFGLSSTQIIYSLIGSDKTFPQTEVAERAFYNKWDINRFNLPTEYSDLLPCC